MKDYFFAVDLGATSGRTLLIELGPNGFSQEEINRFPNHIIEAGGHCYWDIYALYFHIIEGLKIVSKREDTKIRSIGIDTWGVDFVMVGKDGHFLRQPYSYRDQHTDGAPDRFFARFSRKKVYEKTGIQVMNFNSLFQLDTLRNANDSVLEVADKILFIPDALSYMLTGEMVTEYTIASTSQLVNAKTAYWDSELLETVGLSENNFGRFVYPGELIGTLSEEVQRITGLEDIPVVAVGGHDTASAVVAVPAINTSFAYLSSGTWSLMGIETSTPVINEQSEKLNYTNEGGVNHTIRLLKNICGMWLLERCRLIWGEISYAQLIKEANDCVPFRSLINPDDSMFANPANMIDTIQHYCRQTKQEIPETRGQIVRCIMESLALRYREVLDNLQMLSPFKIEVLHVIGGGSKNDALNQFTANAIGIPVVAGPSEATGLGNAMVQSISADPQRTIAELRRIIHEQLSLKKFVPVETSKWEEAYSRYQQIIH